MDCWYQHLWLINPLYKLFYTKDKGKTRTCILKKTHFNTFLIPQFSEGDITTVRLELNENTHHTIANSQHTQRGSTNTNERGELLYDYLLQSNLFICNKGNDPTFITRNRREVLDITMISDPLLNQLEAWKVGIEHSFSDHRYIEFTLSLDCPPAENITNLGLTNWGYYKNLLSRNLHAPPTHIRNGQELDNLVNTFILLP